MKRYVLIVLALVLAGLFFYLAFRTEALPETPKPAATTQETGSSTPQETSPAPQTAQEPSVTIGSVNIPVDVAKTSEEVQKGLSGRLSLDQDKGMLFLFSRAAIYSFWMPDMHFPIDIIWMSSNKKVVGISANVSNDFDPANPEFYKPPSPAQYVLEVNAGFAAKMGIKEGDSAIFSNI